METKGHKLKVACVGCAAALLAMAAPAWAQDVKTPISENAVRLAVSSSIGTTAFPAPTTVVTAATPQAAATPAGIGLFSAGLSLWSDGGTGLGGTVNVSKGLTSGAASIGPVGDVALHRNNGVNYLSFAGGIRVIGQPAGTKVLPFGQALIGATNVSYNSDSFTATTLMFGGGIHIQVAPNLNAVAEFDVMTLRKEGASTTGNRFMFGISVPFGTK